MTGTHAMRIVFPYVVDRDAFVASLWRAIVAAYASARLPEVPDASSLAPLVASAPSWETLCRVACASNDEHVIKAAFTAHDEDHVYGSPLYRVAVARYAKVI